MAQEEELLQVVAVASDWTRHQQRELELSRRKKYLGCLSFKAQSRLIGGRGVCVISRCVSPSHLCPSLCAALMARVAQLSCIPAHLSRTSIKWCSKGQTFSTRLLLPEKWRLSRKQSKFCSITTATVLVNTTWKCSSSPRANQQHTKLCDVPVPYWQHFASSLQISHNVFSSNLPYFLPLDKLLPNKGNSAASRAPGASCPSSSLMAAFQKCALQPNKCVVCPYWKPQQCGERFRTDFLQIPWQIQTRLTWCAMALSGNHSWAACTAPPGRTESLSAFPAPNSTL